MNKDLIQDTLNWFKAAVPAPSEENACVQIGCHIEEMAEFVESISRGSYLGKNLEQRAIDFKTCQPYNMKSVSLVDESGERSVEMLDALCDMIVTAVGVAHMMGWNIKDALAEVNRSNFSKFENGGPVFHPNGKIKKGDNYTPPNLKPYV